MKKFQQLIDEYKSIGIKENDLEYAILAITDGTRRELIVENLVQQRGLIHLWHKRY